MSTQARRLLSLFLLMGLLGCGGAVNTRGKPAAPLGARGERNVSGEPAQADSGGAGGGGRSGASTSANASPTPEATPDQEIPDRGTELDPVTTPTDRTRITTMNKKPGVDRLWQNSITDQQVAAYRAREAKGAREYPVTPDGGNGAPVMDAGTVEVPGQ